MRKTMLTALVGLAMAACAQPAEDQADTQALEEENASGPDASPPTTPDGGQTACADQGDFDLAVFVADIFPILNGEVDLNDPDGVGLGCTRGPCHGNERPGGLTLSAARTPEENLESFACFVDLQRPRRSPVLVCPQGDARCDHPGGVIFDPPGDLNYDRILDYIRDSRP
jgi:hypothetical protein